jgi:hypothetical protein
MDMIAHMRNYQAVFEIPRGRTAILCMANQDEFDKLRKDYDNITKGAKFPAKLPKLLLCGHRTWFEHHGFIWLNCCRASSSFLKVGSQIARRNARCRSVRGTGRRRRGADSAVSAPAQSLS